MPSLQELLEAKAIADAVRNRPKLDALAPGTNVVPSPNTYYVDNPNLNVGGWVPTEGKNTGKAFVTPSSGGRSTMGHEQFHQQYAPNGMPMPDQGTVERRWLVDQLRDRYGRLKKEGIVGEGRGGQPFSLNMAESPEEFMANLAGLHGAQSKGVRLEDTHLGGKILDTPIMRDLFHYYREGREMGPMNEPVDEIRRLQSKYTPTPEPSRTSRIVSALKGK